MPTVVAGRKIAEQSGGGRMFYELTEIRDFYIDKFENDWSKRLLDVIKSTDLKAA